ncbi:hypothetical protein GCM10023186_14570 [Hymenobacter koreensis]|uniref:Uncharacterized protein n=2 Tax=Hymenobacter koreensis TaxID=1084523 RepID=A0ABP8IY22_9BACT
MGVAYTIGAWWLVLKQVQKYQPLEWTDWPQTSSAAGVYAGVAVLLQILSMWLSMSAQDGVEYMWSSVLASLAGQAVMAWGLGAFSIWLEQRMRMGVSPVQ